MTKTKQQQQQLGEAIDSTVLYGPLRFCFKLMAPMYYFDPGLLIRLLVLVIHILVTLLFPLHLMLGLLMQPGGAALFQNLSITCTSLACSLKHVAQLWHLPLIQQIEVVLGQLDKRVVSVEERNYYHKTVTPSAKLVTRVYYGLYSMIYIVFVLTAIAVVLGEQRVLLYTAWMPIDWEHSTFLYIIAIFYQFLGMITEAVQALNNDVFPPLTLCYLAGHVRLLAMRVAELGWNNQSGNTDGSSSSSRYNEELVNCAKDHELIMRLYQITRDTISPVQLVQLIISGANLCIIVCYMLFYPQNAVSFIYYTIFSVVICVQLFPSCYYASVLAVESEKLPYAVFTSNWMSQKAEHRHNTLIMMQFTSRVMTMKPGGIIELNLNAFFETLKMAYSLFAVVVNLK